jgi:hypothetical protein
MATVFESVGLTPASFFAPASELEAGPEYETFAEAPYTRAEFGKWALDLLEKNPSRIGMVILTAHARFATDLRAKELLQALGDLRYKIASSQEIARSECRRKYLQQTFADFETIVLFLR